MTKLVVTDTPKMLRETFCVAQTWIGATTDPRKGEHIDACDELRPMGPDGNHGDLHTPDCGCEL